MPRDRAPDPPRMNHPVVHLAFEDVEATRAGAVSRYRPNRVGICGARRPDKAFCWGDEFLPGGRHMANRCRDDFRSRTFAATVSRRPHRWGRFRPTVTGFSIWPATFGSGPATRSARTGSQRPHAAAVRQRPARTARSSRAARFCARRTTAAAIGPRRASRMRPTPERVTSVFV